MKRLLILIVITLAACNNSGEPPKRLGLPWFEDPLRGIKFQGIEYAMDMPRTFDSGSCIASEGTLVLRRPGVTWYCKRMIGPTSYSLEELLPD